MGQKYNADKDRDRATLHIVPPRPDDHSQDEVMSAIIQKINTAIAYATTARMGTAVEILQQCREELVHWAADMDFHETPKERFIHQYIYDSGLLAMGDFLTRVGNLKDEKLKSKIIKLFGASITESNAPAGDS